MILGLIGDTSHLDIDLIEALDIVEDVKRVQEPYKNANRKFHPEATVVKVGNTRAVSYTHLDVYKRQTWIRSTSSKLSSCEASMSSVTMGRPVSRLASIRNSIPREPSPWATRSQKTPKPIGLNNSCTFKLRSL